MTVQVTHGLTRKQAEILADPARFRVVVAGRRSGKTYEACAELVKAAVSRPRQTCWYVGPTYDDAEDTAWEQLDAFLPHEAVRDTNKTKLRLRLRNGSEIRLKTAEKPRSLRGRGVDLAVWDEFALCDPEGWTALRPALAGYPGHPPGRALFVTTPMGFNWGYDLFMYGVTGVEGWSSHQFTTADGGLISTDLLEQDRSQMDPRQYRQEYEASFETMSGLVYDFFSRGVFPLGNIDPTVEDTGAEIYVGQDFNVHPMASVIAVKAADECHVLDALEIPSSNTEEVAEELRRQYPNRTIIACPDPSGKARKTSAAAGVTDFTILERAGFKVHAPPKAPLVKDRINNTQAMLKNGDGRRRLRIHPRATALIKALARPHHRRTGLSAMARVQRHGRQAATHTNRLEVESKSC
jgi:hypothetical protein